MVCGQLGMPGVFVDIVDLRPLDDVTPGDGHVNLGKPVASARPVDVSVWAGRHVAPVWAGLTQRAGVEWLVPHNSPLRMTSDGPVIVVDVAHPLSVANSAPGPSLITLDIVPLQPILEVKFIIFEKLDW